MNLRPLDWLGWLLALALWIAFFLPWVKFPSRPAIHSLIVRTLTADSDRTVLEQYFTITPDEWKRAITDAGNGITGYEIPQAYRTSGHAREVKVINSSHLLGAERQADRSLFVWGFPALGLLSALFITSVSRKWALLLPFLAAAGFYGLARYMLNTTYLERLTSGEDIGLGLWLSLYALLALAVVLLLRLLLPANTRL